MKWTDEELDILYSEYPQNGSDIPELKRSREAIRTKAYKEGLKYDHRTEVTCDACGDVVEKKDSDIEGHEKHFCDVDCKAKWDSKRFSGSSHPRSGVEVSHEVKEKISQSLSGSNHPHWKDGKKRNYGSSWHEARAERVSKDDFQCQNCGMTRNQHKREYGVDLHVHHITPLREFSQDEEPHKMDNLVTLCMACHRKAEHGLVNNLRGNSYGF